MFIPGEKRGDGFEGGDLAQGGGQFVVVILSGGHAGIICGGGAGGGKEASGASLMTRSAWNKRTFKTIRREAVGWNGQNRVQAVLIARLGGRRGAVDALAIVNVITKSIGSGRKIELELPEVSAYARHGNQTPLWRGERAQNIYAFGRLTEGKGDDVWRAVHILLRKRFWVSRSERTIFAGAAATEHRPRRMRCRKPGTFSGAVSRRFGCIPWLLAGGLARGGLVGLK